MDELLLRARCKSRIRKAVNEFLENYIGHFQRFNFSLFESSPNSMIWLIIILESSGIFCDEIENKEKIRKTFKNSNISGMVIIITKESFVTYASDQTTHHDHQRDVHRNDTEISTF